MTIVAEGQADGKGTALPLFAVNLDGPAVVGNDLFDDIQPDTQAANGLAPVTTNAIEPLEQVWQIYRGNADASIADRDTYIVRSFFQLHRDDAATGAIFNRVLQQVLEHLLQPVLVPVDDQGHRRGQRFERDCVPVEKWLEISHDLRNQGREVKRLAVEAKLACLQAGDIEQHIDKLA